MKATNPWITYRTRFLVKARQLSTSLAFTDDLGRLHSGRKGDYLVESSEGVLSIAPRQIFEDIYVALQPGQSKNSAPNENSSPRISVYYQTLRQDESPRPSTATFSLPAHLTRKSPQPYRDRCTPSLGARFI
jgi:hypothetical protein